MTLTAMLSTSEGCVKARNSGTLSPGVSSTSAKSKRLFSFKLSYVGGRQIHVGQCDTRHNMTCTICVSALRHKSSHYKSDGLLFGVVQNCSIVEVDEPLVRDRVVLLPRYHAVSVRVEFREALLHIFHCVFSVDLLDPQGQLLCGSQRERSGNDDGCQMSTLPHNVE